MRSLFLLLGATLVACNGDTFSNADAGDDGGSADAPADNVVGGEASTGDGASTGWQDMGFPQSVNLYGVWARGNDDVYVVGAGGALANWSGGQWSVIATQTSKDLRAISGDATKELVVGELGTEIVVVGASVTVTSLGGSPNLFGIAFVQAPPDTAWAAGASAVLLHDTTGWVDKSALFSPLTCNGVFDHFAACNGGTMRDLAGTAGSDVAAGTSEDLYGIWSGASGKVLVGHNGAITETSGTGWTAFNTQKPDFTGVFWDVGHLYVTSVDGSVYDATLALATPQTPSLAKTPVGSGKPLRAITASGETGSKYLWVVGDSGTVFRKSI